MTFHPVKHQKRKKHQFVIIVSFKNLSINIHDEYAQNEKRVLDKTKKAYSRGLDSTTSFAILSINNKLLEVYLHHRCSKMLEKST